MRRSALSVLLPAVIILIGAIIFGLANGPTAEAGPGDVTLVAVDGDITGNDDTSTGTIEDCMELASVGDTRTFDIVVQGVDPADRIKGYQATFAYDPAVLRVLDVTEVDAAGSVPPDDVTIISRIDSSGGIGFLPLSDPTPSNSGTFTAAAADTTGNPEPPANHESGDGVLARVTIEAMGAGTTEIELLPPQGGVIIVGASDQEVPVTTVTGAFVGVGGGGCPSTADVSVTTAVAGSPANGTVGTAFNVTGDVSISNAGSEDPVSTDTTIALSMPPDCSTSDPNPVSVQDTSLSIAGSPLALPTQTWSVTCSDPSSHSFVVGAQAAIDQANVSESNPANNSKSSAESSTAIFGTADVEVLDVTVTTPSAETVGTQFPVSANLSAHNNGPLASARVNASFTLTLPADCTTFQQLTQTFTNIALPASVTTVLPGSNAIWNVSCEDPGVHNFGVSASISISQLHLNDPDTNNQSGAAQGSTDLRVGICGPDPDPSGDVLQNQAPLLIALVQELTAGERVVPEGQEFQLSCEYDLSISDNKGAPIDDCELSLVTEVHPCSISIPILMNEPSQLGDINTTRLSPIGIHFIPAAFQFAGDSAVPNGTTVGSADFNIRTDAGLGGLGNACSSDVNFAVRPSIEGGIRGNVPESDDSDDLANPDVWPNDLNAEVAALETAFQAASQHPTPLNLYSRSIAPLTVAGVDLTLNILVFSVDDPAIQQATGARWTVVGFPGDALNPDAPGTLGTDPDLDDPTGAPLGTCAPYATMMSFNGSAGAVTYLQCVTSGEPMAWVLMDPDASIWEGDQGPRSDTSTCSTDLDSDGLSSEEEAYYGTDPLDSDSDNDGHIDGSDNCPVTFNPTQADYDSDGLGDHCDDSDSDGWVDAIDGCPDAVTEWHTPPGDEDCDGFSTPEEEFMGTDPLDACPDNQDDDVWPTDLSSMQGGYGKHDKKVNILDIVHLTPPFFNTTPPNPNYDTRKDMNGDGSVNILDIVRFTPPMFNKSCE